MNAHHRKANLDCSRTSFSSVAVLGLFFVFCRPKIFLWTWHSKKALIKTFCFRVFQIRKCGTWWQHNWVLSIKNERSFFFSHLHLSNTELCAAGSELFSAVLLFHRQKLGNFDAQKNQPFVQLSYADTPFNTLSFVIEEYDGMILVQTCLY